MADQLSSICCEARKKEPKNSSEGESEEYSRKKKSKSAKKKVKLTKIRNDSDSDTSLKRRKQDSTDNSDSESSSKKKKKVKSLSEDIDESPSTAGTIDELTESLRKHFFGLLTPVEEDEMEIPSNTLCACRQMNETQTGYLAQVIPDWEKRIIAHSRKAAPLVLVICASGIRAVSLKRELAGFLKGAKTAKLFSKHMKVSIKIEEQEKYLKSHVVHFGVGTPHRLKALMELGALSLAEVSHVFVDWNWRDQKKRRLIDVSEARCELHNLLKQQIIPQLRKKNNRMKLGLL